MSSSLCTLLPTRYPAPPRKIDADSKTPRPQQRRRILQGLAALPFCWVPFSHSFLDPSTFFSQGLDALLAPKYLERDFAAIFSKRPKTYKNRNVTVFDNCVVEKPTRVTLTAEDGTTTSLTLPKASECVFLSPSGVKITSTFCETEKDGNTETFLRSDFTLPKGVTVCMRYPRAKPRVFVPSTGHYVTNWDSRTVDTFVFQTRDKKLYGSAMCESVFQRF